MGEGEGRAGIVAGNGGGDRIQDLGQPFLGAVYLQADAPPVPILNVQLAQFQGSPGRPAVEGVGTERSRLLDGDPGFHLPHFRRDHPLRLGVVAGPLDPNLGASLPFRAHLPDAQILPPPLQFQASLPVFEVEEFAPGDAQIQVFSRRWGFQFSGAVGLEPAADVGRDLSGMKPAHFCGYQHGIYYPRLGEAHRQSRSPLFFYRMGGDRRTYRRGEMGAIAVRFGGLRDDRQVIKLNKTRLSSKIEIY